MPAGFMDLTELFCAEETLPYHQSTTGFRFKKLQFHCAFRNML